jgi:hypothetical protein
MYWYSIACKNCESCELKKGKRATGKNPLAPVSRSLSGFKPNSAYQKTSSSFLMIEFIELIFRSNALPLATQFHG